MWMLRNYGHSRVPCHTFRQSVLLSLVFSYCTVESLPSATPVIISGGVHKVKAEVVPADLTVMLLMIPYDNFIKHSVGAKWCLSISSLSLSLSLSLSILYFFTSGLFDMCT